MVKVGHNEYYSAIIACFETGMIEFLGASGAGSGNGGLFSGSIVHCNNSN